MARRAAAGQPTVYALPADDPAAAADAGSRSEADSYARTWAARPESQAARCSAADYLVLRALAPAGTATEIFERALTSKLLELSGSDLASNARPGLRLAWLRTGLLRVLASMPAAGAGPGPGRAAPEPVRDCMTLTPWEEEVNRRAVERLRGWKPPPIDPASKPIGFCGNAAQIFDSGLLPSDVLPNPGPYRRPGTTPSEETP